MNIQDLGNIGEFVSGFAVLATLVYLAIQVRAMRASTFVETAGQVIGEETQLNALDIEHADLLIKADEGQELTKKERFVLERLYRTHMSYYFHQYFRVETLDSDMAWIAIRGCCDLLESNHGFMNLFAGYDSETDPDANVKVFTSKIRDELRRRGNA